MNKNKFRQIAATIIDVAYGIEAPGSDPIIDIAEAAIATFSTAAVPGAFLVDTFPFLKYVPEWVPGAGFQRKAREWKKLSQAMLNEPFDILMKAIVSRYNSSATIANYLLLFIRRRMELPNHHLLYVVFRISIHKVTFNTKKVSSRVRLQPCMEVSKLKK